MKKNGKFCVNIPPCMKKLKPESTYMRTKFLSNSTKLHGLCVVQRLGYCNISSKSVVRAHVQSLSHDQLFATPWTVALQTSLSMEFSRQKYWSGLPFSPPGHLLTQRLWTHISCVSCTAGRFSKSVNTECDQWALKRENKNPTLLKATHTAIL